MSTISCSFCTSANPPDAKFCNQCGSPLGLKPCPACEAVNEAAAKRCHQCGAAFDVLAVEPIASSMEPATAAVATDAVSDLSSPAAAESIPAAPFTVDAALDAPIHIPESFADRLERDAGPHAFERVEPRIAPPEERNAPEVGSPYLRSTVARPRERAWRAPLALAAFVAIAGAGYYVYTRDVPGLDRLAEFALAGRRAAAPASVESRSGESPGATAPSDVPTPDAASKPTNAAPNAPQSTPASATAVAGAPATESNPATAALVSVQPGAPGQPQAHGASTLSQVDAGSTQSAPGSANPKARPSAAPPRNDDEAARQRTDAASRSRRQAEADAIATQRLIARDLGTAIGPPANPPANAPAAPLDRDAAETQRLIERDLGPFLHRNDRSLRGGTYPAIN
ncbi:MAG TPA: zinc ribbon domain-containing protein [Casimicrobiaceae bacterium]|nr:zinc ribbon domain-containing protein [Casimicrobiaceae bacterium]